MTGRASVRDFVRERRSHVTPGLPPLANLHSQRWHSPPKIRFAPESPVEGRRFELSVPPEKDWPYGTIVIDLCPSGPREEVAPDDDPGDRVAAGIARQDPAQEESDRDRTDIPFDPKRAEAGGALQPCSRGRR